MLRFLRIRSLAVIDILEVEFEPGFNVISGETGAGKSMLIEAVGLLLGGRASPDLVRTGEAQATVEAVFEAPDDQRATTELIVRREVTTQGRSRAFLDGALVTATALRDRLSGLIELHGQHEHQTLLDPATHLPLLDAFAGLEAPRADVARRWGALREAREQLSRAQLDDRERSARLELLALHLGEIEKAAPEPDEDERLAATRQVLASADHVLRLCEASYGGLYESEQSVLSTLSGVWKRVGELAALDPAFAPYLDQRDAIKGQLEDLAVSLRDYAARIDASPERLADVESRLAMLERLKRKHGPTLGDVIARANALRRERDLLNGGAERVAELEQGLRTATAAYTTAAEALSSARREAAPVFAARVEGLLAQLAMGRVRVGVQFADLAGDAHWSETGVDVAELYLSANVGEDLRPLARIASGGELSRVMLALKTLAARQGTARTLIFDEVDAGIGGQVADVVGGRLRALAREFQVLCVTHLPQIAAHAAVHFRIEKRVRGARTVTSVHRLPDAERTDELARMMGGTLMTEHVKAGAADLLRRAAEGPAPPDKRKRKSSAGESES